MSGQRFHEIFAFLAVAREGSFTRAAAQLGMSQSALSHTIRSLEARLGIRLLTRTTRSVSTTEAGERLLLSLGPRFEEIESEIASLNELREKPSGTIRISATDFAADTVLWPKLSKALQSYPDIKVEINLNYGLVDIVADRFDAGVRFGDQVAKDMIAVRIGPDVRMAVVGSASYFNRMPALETPQDLTAHDCINLRLPTHDSLLAWEFEKEGKQLNVHVQGQWVFNNSPSILRAALSGFGLGYLPEEMAKEHVAAGRLKLALQDWCPTFPGHHLYYPSRRQSSPAFAVVLDALRYKG